MAILSGSNGRAYMFNPLYALNSVPGLSDLQGQISTLSTLIGTGGGASATLWANYPAIDNVNIANNNIYSTNALAFINGSQILNINYAELSNISTAAGGVATGGANIWATYPAITNINVNSNSVQSTVNINLINNADSINITYISQSNISSAAGQAFSTGQGLVPRVTALESFSTAQTTSNIRYDDVSTAFVGLSNNVFLLSTTIISTISTWTGTYAGTGGGGGGDPTLPGRVAALETFSTVQVSTNNTRYNSVSTLANQTFSIVSSIIDPVIQTSTNLSTLSYYTLTLVNYNILVRNDLSTLISTQIISNIRYDTVSTAFTATSTATGQAFSTGQGLVPRVAALETFSTVAVSTFNTISITADTLVLSSIVTSSISTFTASGTANIQQVTELMDFEVNATGNWPHNFNNGSIFYHSSIVSNFTTSLFNVPTNPGRGAIVTLVLIQGATPYYSSTLTINGSATPIQWANSSIPVPTAFKIECESFTLLNISGTWSALGQYTSFGTA